MAVITSPRRRAALLAIACFAALPGLSHALDGFAYPQKPIRLVVPFPAGGGSDTLARLLGRELTAMWGKPVVVENKPGASGTIGTGVVAKAAPDGYTLLLGATPLVQLQGVYKSLPYDTFRDLAPLARLALSSDVFVAPVSSGVGSVGELVAEARARPGKFSYGSYGNGTSSHMHGELLRMQAKVDLTHVAYKGGSPLAQDLLGGQVSSGFVDVASSKAALSSPKIRVLAVTGERRLQLLPDAPTFTELGYRDYEPNGWYGLFVPAATPKPVRDKLATAVLTILARPAMQTAIRELGLEPGTLEPEAFLKLMRRDAEIWGRIASEARITLD
ncbi:Extra-cytoplasmic solute receptor [Cupriavidus taiwanensis]|uniref:Bug family tripartite tricarboxylate transporter substrate binding protein n=1 Tax=Cupriavidus taiwanensis TaxID=164546 RepID=UPI000E1AB16E|nr:tripartite tricarboxylate transporter substrate binding protein [Cupriavidus taiwanensis]SPA34268.1 Extra-cytoplasmic solute receptor [Cupriavidus taiwanensis]